MEVLYQLSYPGGSSDSRREAPERAGLGGADERACFSAPPSAQIERGSAQRYPPEAADGLNGTPELRVVDFQPSGSCFITK